MAKPLVTLVLGSDSDLPVMNKCEVVLKEFEVPFTARILSAHRTPVPLAEHIRKSERDGVQVVIAAAGGAAHLAGVCASHTTLPVIGCPMPSVLDGLDSALSTLQMPGGIPVATMAIGNAGAQNAALFAIAILALRNKKFHNKLVKYRKDMLTAVLAKDEKLQSR